MRRALVGCLLVITACGGSDSADSDEPEQIANLVAMYDALNAHDAEAYAGYWAEGAEGWGPFIWRSSKAVVGSADMEKGFEERRAWGAQFTVSNCELVGETVTCHETWNDRVYRDMAGIKNDTDVTYLFDDQAMITGMAHSEYVSSEWAPFMQEFGPWLRTAHSEIADTYLVAGFDDSFKMDNWFATPESVAEITSLIEEFVAQSDVYPLAP
jgi:hypothetical protein